MTANRQEFSDRMTSGSRTAPLGATITPEGVYFGIWATAAERVEVTVETGGETTSYPMERNGQGVYRTLVRDAGAGIFYRFSVDGTPRTPDPRSRYQPFGVHGPSEVIDLSAFAWTDDDWIGLRNENLSIYELHVGSFTHDGTFDALSQELQELKRLGVRAIELMPVADFPGRWNWGYDGVALYAPSRAYGRPEDLQRLIDTAHRVGLGVLLDVVYNHLGPDGNYLRHYSGDYFTDRHHTPWGAAVNYDGPNARFVRDFVIDNAIQWVRDYHFDGLRLDATDTIQDDSNPHILRELQERVRMAVNRDIVLIAEEARNDVRTITPPAQGGYGFDAVWADDFHHEMRVLLSNARENYYADFTGSIENLAKALNEGFIYQGEESPFWGKPRGTPVTDEPATAFVIALQNHDQIGNRPFGERLHHEIDRERFLAASAVLLLAPETPLIFMGQEFVASTPFRFFTDHHEALGRLVTEGRRKEFAGFRAFAEEDMQRHIPDPQAEQTFLSSKLRLSERAEHDATYRLYQRLLELRHGDPVFQVQDRSLSHAHALRGTALLLHRWRAGSHRVLIANFGAELIVPVGELDLGCDDCDMNPARWHVMFASAEGDFVQQGTPGTFRIPARTAVLFSFGTNGESTPATPMTGSLEA
jgi:maltooligosyltrehalose trehalohydrolase